MPLRPPFGYRVVSPEIVYSILHDMEYVCIGEREGNFVYEHQRYPNLIILLDLSRPVILRDVLDQLKYQGENIDVFMAHLESIEGI